MAIAMQNYIKDIEKLVSVLTIEAHMRYMYTIV